MAIRDAMLPEFDHEMALTRKTLERIPDDKVAWKPHEKSMSMGKLAGHLADVPSFASLALRSASYNLAVEGKDRKSTVMASRNQILEVFDKNVAAARAALSSATDDELKQVWKLSAGDRVIFELPKAAVLRSLVLNHTIHHRAQMGVYLRLNDVPVPSIYGPSADESM